MAATAYAALVSLLNTMDLIQIHPLLSICFRKYPNQSLREKIDFFLDFVEKYSDAESEEAEDLVRRIADVAHEAEDLIEAQASNRIHVASITKRRVGIPGKLKKIIEEMDCIKEKVIKAWLSAPPASTVVEKETCSYADSEEAPAIVALEPQEISQVQATAAPPPAPHPKKRIQDMDSVKENMMTTMVGFDVYLHRLLDQLTGHHSGRQILPIVGMGGIGKTTLATNAFHNLLIVQHFDVLAWITVSQQFSASQMILQALSCLGGFTSDTDTIDDHQLGEKLSKLLHGRRYLIILDDVWSVEAWEKIMFFLPENNNGSRIVITTRQSKVVDYFGSPALAVDFLDDKNSWELFCEKAFSQQKCPHPELEQVAKKIVKNCKGLPLTIAVIGGLLGKSSRTREYWEKIAKDKSLILDSGEGNVKPLSILNLSYKHLPVWLKPCFLYLGLYPEDNEIDASQLTKLWIAEGFIKPNRDQSLEEVAEGYIKELIGRNLLIVGGMTHYNKLESCRVHGLVRDMCIRIGEKESFYYVQRYIDGMGHMIVDERRTRSHPHTSETPSLISPPTLERQTTPPFKSRLMRVLYCGDGNDLDSAFREANLRFLVYQYYHVYELPSSIALLWRLQTLIVIGRSVVAPPEIWKMPHLRHIEMTSIYLPPPPSDDVIVLKTLQTLKRVENLILSEEICTIIPNIKDLEIGYYFDEIGGASWCCHLQNVGRLHNLESLDIFCCGWESVANPLQNHKVPSSLKELRLHNSNLVWSDMTMIGLLPHLQILELEYDAVVGPTWNCAEGGFLCLKHLDIVCGGLMNWFADRYSFPVLETLSLKGLQKLKEIPPGIGEIPTLREIELLYCNDSICLSAVEILNEQESLGNLDLQLQLKFRNKNEANTWREKVQKLGITPQNLHISASY